MRSIFKKFVLTTLFALFASQASALFIQADWLDPTAPGVGTNRYAYSNNDPVNRFDPGGNQSRSSETTEYLTEDEYRQAANDVNREIESLQNEWDNNPQRNDAAYAHDLQQLGRQAETYSHYAGVSDQERIDHFRQGVVGPAAGALTLGVGVGTQATPGQMPRVSPVVGAVPRPTQVPTNWATSATRKGVGTRYVDPANPKSNIVRVDVGNANNSQPFQQVDHVVVISNGRVIGPSGSPISGSIREFPDAHIPLSTYRNWSSWNAP